jgi:hypothetical protein
MVLVTVFVERGWALGYYYVLFEDPDGIRLEVNFIPGVGLLNKDEGFGSGEDYVRVDGQDLTGASYYPVVNVSPLSTKNER